MVDVETDTLDGSRGLRAFTGSRINKTVIEAKQVTGLMTECLSCRRVEDCNDRNLEFHQTGQAQPRPRTGNLWP